MEDQLFFIVDWDRLSELEKGKVVKMFIEKAMETGKPYNYSTIFAQLFEIGLLITEAEITGVINEIVSWGSTE